MSINYINYLGLCNNHIITRTLCTHPIIIRLVIIEWPKTSVEIKVFYLRKILILKCTDDDDEDSSVCLYHRNEVIYDSERHTEYKPNIVIK